MREEAMRMQVKEGDIIEVETERTGQAQRQGTVLEILEETPNPTYKIRWEDGHESVLMPAAGAVRVLGAE
jgi:translation initiation factor IF-1